MILRTRATIEQDGPHLAVVLEDGQKIRLTKAEATHYEVGDQVIVRILPESQDTEDSQALARSVLNELMTADV